MKRLFVLMSCAVLLSACATRTPMPAWKPVVKAAPAPQLYDAQGRPVERVAFRAGVSSVTVEKLAQAQGCTGGQGAGLISATGPVETYRMVCDSNQIFVARCEFRQCVPVAPAPPGGYAVRAVAPTPQPVAAPMPQLAAVPAPQAAAVATSPVAAAAMPAGAAPVTAIAGAPVQGGNRAGLGAMEVPKLAVIWDCGKCEPNPKVAPLIEASYANAAIAKGFSVSKTQVAPMTIHSYRQRPVAVRVLFGIMAGTDYLKTRVQFDGKTVLAEDYSANAIYGMNQLCDVVGQKAFAELIASAR